MRTIIGVMKKELLETIRDRRTLIVSVFIPILMMPLMMAVFIYFMPRASAALKVALPSAPDSLGIREVLDESPLAVVSTPDPLADLLAGKVQVVVSVAPGERQNRLSATVSHTSERSSVQAAAVVSERLIRLGKTLSVQELASLGIDESVLEPITVRSSAVDAGRRSNLPGIFFSLIVVIWTTVGAMYPAADVTAGERERRTLENLLMTPAPDSRVVLGKFVSVYVVSLVTLVLAAGATAAMLEIAHIEALTIRLGENAVGVSIAAAVLTLVTTALISAAEMIASAYARSFREAQTYLTPIFMLVIIPGILPAVVPGVIAKGFLYYVPFMNNTLAISELSLSILNWRHYVPVVVVSLAVTVWLLLQTAGLLRAEVKYRQPPGGRQS
ncbi:MAG: ABC transporter permease subunit [Acetobacteraceae bacterium]|nr:ABC transporter permease subunit [Acetobacteraceae bacterium]